MIKYKVIFDGDEGIVIVEDGGVASWHNSDSDYILMEYYQDRIAEDTTMDTIWEDLGEGKMYSREFPENTSNKFLIQDALEWLVCGYSIEDFEIDETIFPNIK